MRGDRSAASDGLGGYCDPQQRPGAGAGQQDCRLQQQQPSCGSPTAASCSSVRGADAASGQAAVHSSCCDAFGAEGCIRIGLDGGSSSSVTGSSEHPRSHGCGSGGHQGRHDYRSQLPVQPPCGGSTAGRLGLQEQQQCRAPVPPACSSTSGACISLLPPSPVCVRGQHLRQQEAAVAAPAAAAAVQTWPLSANRLQQLRAMCRAWHGPLSAVVYYPLELYGSGGDGGGHQQHVAAEGAFPAVATAVAQQGGAAEGSAAAGAGGLSATAVGRRALLLQHEVGAGGESGSKGGGLDGSGGDSRAEGSSASTAGAAATAGAAGAERPRVQLSLAQLSRLREVVEAVRGFWSEMEARRWCSLDVLLVYEAWADPRAARALYPVNMLRNWARLQARTPLVAALDVDMLPSRQLLVAMKDPATARQYIEACAPSSSPSVSVAPSSDGSGDGSHSMGRTASGAAHSRSSVFILPAFQTANETAAATNIRIADRIANMTKNQLEVAVQVEAALPFHVLHFPAGHSATNFSRWFRAAEPYSVRYVRNFEPWFVAGRDAVPWHDVRLRGYGQNKIIQVAAAAASGVEFRVEPSAFLVHRPHARSGAKQELGGETAAYRRLYRLALRQATASILGQLQQQQEQGRQQSQAVAMASLQGLASSNASSGPTHEAQQPAAGTTVDPTAGGSTRQSSDSASSLAGGMRVSSNNAAGGSSAFSSGDTSSADAAVPWQEIGVYPHRSNRRRALSVFDPAPFSIPPKGIVHSIMRPGGNGPEAAGSTQRANGPALPAQTGTGSGRTAATSAAARQRSGGGAGKKGLALPPKLQAEARRQAEELLAGRFADALKHNVFWSNSRIWGEARKEMAQGQYTPVLDPGTEHCLRVLPWWIGSS
ncbi:hypothetical protein HXX76_005667 [Chlamydomonas incerta]|uniref:Uncharacterized protein n=1 Tax=Chlamydomonas incerta TaxID=51695 RepID=A0A835W2E9_CHLIN|nr:hypothetical protein HXX76_005667 [Chlamydomonas incerta]|eukprot:KAG2438057.1 hypothetical protein HXX76_005667 [Chlamydomonas incerta]